MWPGRRRRARARRASPPRSAPRPKRTAPSRLPWTPRSSPTCCQPQSSGIRQSSPITSPPASRIGSSSVAVPVPKWIVGHSTASRIRAEYGCELLVVGRRERADPRVEELDHVGAGAHLRGDVRARRRRRASPSAHARSRARRTSAASRSETHARLALDQVAGDGEWSAAKADHGLVGRSSRRTIATASRMNRTDSSGSAPSACRRRRANGRAGRSPDRRSRPARRSPIPSGGSVCRRTSPPHRRRGGAQAAVSPRRRARARSRPRRACASSGSRGTPAANGPPGA